MTTTELEDFFRESTEQSLSEECAAFESLLRITLRALDRVRLVEQNWRNELRAGRLPFDFQFDQLIDEEYRRWVEHARRRLQQIEIQERDGCSPDGAEEFRRRLKEVEDTLEMRDRARLAAEGRSKLLDSSA